MPIEQSACEHEPLALFPKKKPFTGKGTSYAHVWTTRDTVLRKRYFVNIKLHNAIAGTKWSKALHIFVPYAFHLERELNMWANFCAIVLNENPFAFVCVFCFHICCLQAEVYRFSQVTLKSNHSVAAATPHDDDDADDDNDGDDGWLHSSGCCCAAAVATPHDDDPDNDDHDDSTAGNVDPARPNARLARCKHLLCFRPE